MLLSIVVPGGAPACIPNGVTLRARDSRRPGHVPVLTTIAGLVSVTGSAWRIVPSTSRTRS